MLLLVMYDHRIQKGIWNKILILKSASLKKILYIHTYECEDTTGKRETRETWLFPPKGWTQFVRLAQQAHLPTEQPYWPKMLMLQCIIMYWNAWIALLLYYNKQCKKRSCTHIDTHIIASYKNLNLSSLF